MKKVDEIVGDLVEGRCYLVPTIIGSLNGCGPMEEYPVIGPRHYDVEFFNVHMPHYHLDLRFVHMSTWHVEYGKKIIVGAGRRNDNSLPKVNYRKMRCLQYNVVVSVASSDGSGSEARMHRQFKGKRCGGSRKKGWICPHKGAFLGSTPSNQGVITCPCHALKIDANTGIVL